MAQHASFNRLIAWLVTLVSVLPIIGMAQCTPRFVGMTLDQVKAQSKFTIYEETYGDLNGDGEDDFVLYLHCNAYPDDGLLLLGLTNGEQQKVVNQYAPPYIDIDLDVFSYPLNLNIGNSTLYITQHIRLLTLINSFLIFQEDMYLVCEQSSDIEYEESRWFYRNYIDGIDSSIYYPFGRADRIDGEIIRTSKAIEALPKRIVPYDPNHPERGEEYYAYNRDGFLAGDSLMKHHQYEEAVDAYDQQVIQNPWDDEVYLARAKARHMADDFVGRCEDWYMASKLGNSEASRLAGKYCQEDTSEETE